MGELHKWFQLAYAVGLVVGSREEEGIQYVISPAGTLAPYAQIAEAYPISVLRQLSDRQGS